jgi:hypothetical protein
MALADVLPHIAVHSFPIVVSVEKRIGLGLSPVSHLFVVRFKKQLPHIVVLGN